MIFLFPRWDMLIPWRVLGGCFQQLLFHDLPRCLNPWVKNPLFLNILSKQPAIYIEYDGILKVALICPSEQILSKIFQKPQDVHLDQLFLLSRLGFHLDVPARRCW